jgi:hypothetical protein
MSRTYYFICDIFRPYNVQRRPPKVVQNRIESELVKRFLNGKLVKLMFFSEIYIEKEQIACAKMTKPCGSLLDMFSGLGL